MGKKIEDKPLKKKACVPVSSVIISMSPLNGALFSKSLLDDFFPLKSRITKSSLFAYRMSGYLCVYGKVMEECYQISNLQNILCMALANGQQSLNEDFLKKIYF